MKNINKEHMDYHWYCPSILKFYKMDINYKHEMSDYNYSCWYTGRLGMAGDRPSGPMPWPIREECWSLYIYTTMFIVKNTNKRVLKLRSITTLKAKTPSFIINQILT